MMLLRYNILTLSYYLKVTFLSSLHLIPLGGKSETIEYRLNENYLC